MIRLTRLTIMKYFAKYYYQGGLVMRITSKGQVTIPRDIRQKLGISTHSEVEFVIEGDTVVVRKTEGVPTRGKRLVETLRGRATVKMTTDEIMALTRGEP